MFEGDYKFQGTSGGMDYWVNFDYAIWYKEAGENIISFWWLIGTLEYLDSATCVMYSTSQSNSMKKRCPYNEGSYIWNWNVGIGSSFIASNDVHIKCGNEDDFCTSANPCGTNEGDCDNHDECQGGLFCGSNNCPASFGFHSEFDCCYVPAVGDEHFCTISNPCAENEGDCDSDIECQDGLACGSKTCPTSLGFDSEIDCCYVLTVCGNIDTINSLKNSDSDTIAGWTFDLENGPWNLGGKALIS